MRGILQRLKTQAKDARIIPAHAGNTTLHLILDMILSDHPRSCGEYGQ